MAGEDQDLHVLRSGKSEGKTLQLLSRLTTRSGRYVCVHTGTARAARTLARFPPNQVDQFSRMLAVFEDAGGGEELVCPSATWPSCTWPVRSHGNRGTATATYRRQTVPDEDSGRPTTPVATKVHRVGDGLRGEDSGGTPKRARVEPNPCGFVPTLTCAYTSSEQARAM